LGGIAGNSKVCETAQNETFNQRVVGSKPTGLAKFSDHCASKRFYIARTTLSVLRAGLRFAFPPLLTEGAIIAAHVSDSISHAVRVSSSELSAALRAHKTAFPW
jgi:hypothetical protein